MKAPGPPTRRQPRGRTSQPAAGGGAAEELCSAPRRSHWESRATCWPPIRPCRPLFAACAGRGGALGRGWGRLGLGWAAGGWGPWVFPLVHSPPRGALPPAAQEVLKRVAHKDGEQPEFLQARVGISPSVGAGRGRKCLPSFAYSPACAVACRRQFMPRRRSPGTWKGGAGNECHPGASANLLPHPSPPSAAHPRHTQTHPPPKPHPTLTRRR